MEDIKEVVIQLEKLSYLDWIKIKSSVDYAFNLKRKELERNLKLNSNEIEQSIQSQFG